LSLILEATNKKRPESEDRRLFMERGLVLIALALISLSACAPGTASPTGSGAEATRMLTASPPKDPGLVVGDEVTTTEDGNTLTVLSYESPRSVGGARPDRGSAFSVVEVEGCAGRSSAEDLMHVGSGAFTLRLPDGDSVQPEDPPDDAHVKQPDLRTMDPGPGTCTSGFVTFQTPRGARPDLVVFEEEYVLESAIAWKIPDGG
jgi:hypothetical protein